MKRLLAFLASTAICSGAFATTTPNSFVTPQTPNRGVVRFLQGTDSPGVNKTLYTAGANGSRCYGMWMTTNDGTATHLVNIEHTTGVFATFGVAITTVLGAGSSAGVPAQALMTPSTWPGLPIDQYGNPYLQLNSGDGILALYSTALTAGTQINVYVSCEDF
jgi:hypothetical protein